LDHGGAAVSVLGGLARVELADGPAVVILEAPPSPRQATGSTGAALATVDGKGFADLPDLLVAAAGRAEAIAAGDGVSIEGRTLLPAVGQPRKVVCVGINYRSHADEGDVADPPHPVLFAKWSSALTGPYADVPLPPESSMVDWESELAVVIGRPARRAQIDEAGTVIFGYTIANDISMRDFQRHTSQWTAGKTWDRATPVGPAVVPAQSCGGPRPDLEMRALLNGETVQHARTSEMIFGVPELIAYITTVMTLDPGDLILTGTCSGVGSSRTPPRWLTDGDVLEVQIEGLGAIRSRYTAEP
jgi:acylpyruvate hydrolase